MDCLKVLWQRPEATVAEVRAQLPRPLAYTTVMTVLDRMSAKGTVSRRKNGRAYVYSAVLDHQTACAHALRQLLANFFEHDARALVRYLSAEPPPAAPRNQAVKPVRRVPAARRSSEIHAPRPSSIDDSLL
jgi:predicted transcriptional regulator